MFQRSLIVLLFSLSVLRAEEIYEVEIGKTLNLECAIGAKYLSIPTTYQWFNAQNKVLGSNINMVIPVFSFEDQGIYTCEATQVLKGEPITIRKSIHVKVKNQNGNADSTMKISIPKKHEAFASGILFLRCKNANNFDAKYDFEWTAPNGVSEKRATFFKSRMRLEDAGRYYCKMTRKSDGVVQQDFTEVNVLQLPINIETISGSIMLGESAYLKCEVDKKKTESLVYSRFSYTWQDENDTIISNTQVVAVNFDSPSKFGTYKCTIKVLEMKPPYYQTETIELKSATETIKEVSNLRVRQVENQPIFYTVNFITRPKIKRYFEKLEIVCAVIPPLPAVTYEIYFNDKLVSNTDTYVIPRLGKNNHGAYNCSISGTNPQTSQPVKLKTGMQILPDFFQSSKIELSEPPGPQLFVHADEKKELHCEIPPNEKFQGSDAYWLFNGTNITKSLFKEYKIENLVRLYVNIIKLRNIQSINEGKYECKYGKETREAFLFVVEKDRLIEVNPAKEIRKAGDRRAVEFHCKLDNYQSKNKDIIWTFKSHATGLTTALDKNWERDDSELTDQTSFILLKELDMRHGGLYICTDPITKDNAHAELIIEDSGIEVVTPPVVEVIAGQTARIPCHTTSAGRSAAYPQFDQQSEGRSANDPQMSTEKLEQGKIQLVLRNVSTNLNGSIFTCRYGRSMGNVTLLVSKGCPMGLRSCKNEKCIDLKLFCDGKPDCEDGSDEDMKSCPGIVVTPRIVRIEASQTARIQCYTVHTGSVADYPELVQVTGQVTINDSRIAIVKLEDGKIQLNFREVTTSDNGTIFTFQYGNLTGTAVVLVSPVCATGFRFCRNGTCINSAKFCDGTPDCADGSDEDTQFCNQCDPIVKECKVHNGEQPTNKVYQTHWVCDGDDDCGNGFDESQCVGSYLECGGLTYQCPSSNKTIPKAFLCDKETDCDKGEDESKCVVPTILSEKPESYNLNGRQGESVEITCQVTGYPLPRIVWRFNWGCIPENERLAVTNSNINCETSVSALRISNFQPGDDGIYTCEALSAGKRAWSKEYQLFMTF